MEIGIIYIYLVVMCQWWQSPGGLINANDDMTSVNAIVVLSKLSKCIVA